MISRFLFLLLVFFCAIHAQARDFVSERSWVEDPSGTMSLEEVKQEQETSLATKLFSKGYSRSAFWLRLRIDPSRVDDPSVQSLIVRIRPPYQDQIWLFDPLAPKDQVRMTGDYYDWAEDEYRSLNLNFVIPVGQEPRDIWLRIKASVSTLTFIEVMTPDQVRAADRQQEIVIMLYLSALFVCFGWAVLTRINRKDGLLTLYLIREFVVITYAFAILGYLRVFSPAWFPPSWVDQSTNFIAFTFIATLIWFDWKLIGEFKPNKWISRLHGGLILFLPIAVVLMFVGKTHEAARLSSLVVVSYMILALSSVLSTQAWKQARHAQSEEQPICSKSFLVSIYGLAIAIAFLHRLPIMGASSGNDLFFYFNLVYPLLTSIIERLLQVERLEDERIDIQPQAIDLLEMVNSLRISLPEGERIGMHLDGQLDLQSDPQLVRIILSNLLENALKYSPKDSDVTIHLFGDVSRVFIQVENAVGSAGFPDPHQVFKKYYRSALAQQRTGSGLGLYLVQSLVKLLGGSVQYEPKAETIRFMVEMPTKQVKV